MRRPSSSVPSCQTSWMSTVGTTESTLSISVGVLSSLGRGPYPRTGQSKSISRIRASSYTERNEAVYWIIEELTGPGEQTIDSDILRLHMANNAERSVKLNRRTVYYSQAALREAVKCLYDYHCQICHARVYSPGWVTTLPRKQQWRYLNADAHHIRPLSQEGPDVLENLLCLCPTCHRRFHTEEFVLQQYGSRIGCEDVVLHTQTEVTTKHTIVLF